MNKRDKRYWNIFMLFILFFIVLKYFRTKVIVGRKKIFWFKFLQLTFYICINVMKSPG